MATFSRRWDSCWKKHKFVLLVCTGVSVHCSLFILILCRPVGWLWFTKLRHSTALVYRSTGGWQNFKHAGPQVFNRHNLPLTENAELHSSSTPWNTTAHHFYFCNQGFLVPFAGRCDRLLSTTAGFYPNKATVQKTASHYFTGPVELSRLMLVLYFLCLDFADKYVSGYSI